MKYSLRRTGHSTAKIVIESTPFIDHSVKPEIWRFSPNGWHLVSTSDEAVIGRTHDAPCALVFRVRRNDIVATREVLLGGRETAWNYYRIDSNFHPHAVFAPGEPFPSRDCVALLKAHNEGEPAPCGSEEAEVRRFFSQRHPRWLQEIVDRQIKQWRRKSPDRFFRFAPDALQERGIERCVEEAPFAALARFRHLLDEAQIQDCITRSPRGAVIYAMEQVPESKRENYLIEHATEAMEFAAGKLSDNELGRCAWLDMRTGFNLRAKFPPPRHAIILANSYPINFLENRSMPLAELHHEIRVSLIEFPDQWRASNVYGFPSILEELQEKISMNFDPDLILALLEKINPDDRAALATFFASHI